MRDWVLVDNGGPSMTTSPTHRDRTPGVFQGFGQMVWHFESADHRRTRMLMRVEFWDDLPTGDVRLGKISGRTASC